MEALDTLHLYMHVVRVLLGLARIREHSFRVPPALQHRVRGRGILDFTPTVLRAGLLPVASSHALVRTLWFLGGLRWHVKVNL